MRTLFFVLLGTVLGAASGVALLYFNPLTVERAPRIDATMTLQYDVEAPDTLALTHGGRIELPFRPLEIGELWEATISRSALGVFVLGDANDAPVAIGSRISQLSESSNLLTTGIVQSDYWLITYPGRGTMYLEVDSNVWPFARQTIVEVELLGRPWEGPRRFGPTIGPGAAGTAVLTGASGFFADRYGSAAETYTMDRYVKGRPYLEGLRARLDLRLLGGDEDRADAELPARATPE